MVVIAERNTFPNQISVYSNPNFLTQMMSFAQILLPSTPFIPRIDLRNNTVCCLVDQAGQEDRSVCLPLEEKRQSFISAPEILYFEYKLYFLVIS